MSPHPKRDDSLTEMFAAVARAHAEPYIQAGNRMREYDRTHIPMPLDETILNIVNMVFEASTESGWDPEAVARKVKSMLKEGGSHGDNRQDQ